MTYKKYCISWLKKNGYFKIIQEFVKRHKITNNFIDSHFDNLEPHKFIKILLPKWHGIYKNKEECYENILYNKIEEIHLLWIVELYKINSAYFMPIIESEYYIYQRQSYRPLAYNLIAFIGEKKRMPNEEEIEKMKTFKLSF